METYINNKLITKIVLYDEYDAGFEYYEHTVKKIVEYSPRWIREHDPHSPMYKTEDFNENIYRIDWTTRRIYTKPQVIIYTTDKNKTIQHFDTIKEAREFLNDILAKNQDINVIIK